MEIETEYVRLEVIPIITPVENNQSVWFCFIALSSCLSASQYHRPVACIDHGRPFPSEQLRFIVKPALVVQAAGGMIPATFASLITGGIWWLSSQPMAHPGLPNTMTSRTGPRSLTLTLLLVVHGDMGISVNHSKTTASSFQ